MAQTSSAQVCGVFPSSSEARVQSKLNPFAKEWNPSAERGSEEERSLFFTFSSGHPLRRSQIWRFFSEKYGDCVERIVLRSKAQKGTPLFGKVVFKISTVPVLILNGKDEVKFWSMKDPFGAKVPTEEESACKWGQH
ncbi:hypothetical protein AAG906_007884 [Vitis piasezkii]